MSRTTAEHTVRVLLAQHATLEGKLLLEALKSAGRFEFESCVPEASDILRTSRECRAAVVVVAHSGGHDPLLEVVRSVQRACSGCKLIVLFNDRQRMGLPELFRLGVRGVTSIETAEIEVLCKCIAHVSEGHFWLSAQELDIVLEEFSRSCSMQLVNQSGKELLSPRELDVVMLLAEGLTNRDIAVELKISPNTVRNYLTQVFDKVGVSTRTELVRFALASNHPRPSQSSGAGCVPLDNRRRPPGADTSSRTPVFEKSTMRTL